MFSLTINFQIQSWPLKKKLKLMQCIDFAEYTSPFILRAGTAPAQNRDKKACLNQTFVVAKPSKLTSTREQYSLNIDSPYLICFLVFSLSVEPINASKSSSEITENRGSLPPWTLPFWLFVYAQMISIPRWAQFTH